jgi:peptidoglycan/xylan/chitin deacetylase (PgdA/CDA1 family)
MLEAGLRATLSRSLCRALHLMVPVLLAGSALAIAASPGSGGSGTNVPAGDARHSAPPSGGATGMGSRSAPNPIPVASSVLSQSGEVVVWRVTLASRFSAAGLRADQRTLCLVLERARGGSVAGVACVEPRRSGRGTALVYQRVTAAGRGRPHVVAARISRGSSRALTAAFSPSEVGVAWGPVRFQVLSTLRATACAAGGRGAVCSRFFPARPRLVRLHVPRPVGCVPSGASYVTNGSRAQKVVALTFDDGPWYDTPQFLDILERNHVHATFFQIGRQVSTYGPAVDDRMLADGDFIGDHTWDHASVAGDGPHAAWEISSTFGAIRGLTGLSTCLFRAPGGAVSSALIDEAHRMGFVTIEWDVDPQDWRRPGTSAILANVLGNVRPGSIVIQHDGGGDRSQTLAALPTEISVLRHRGYRFATIPELLGLKVIYK